MKISNINKTANYFNNKYKLVSKASEMDLFKDSSSLSEILGMINGGIDEYKDFLYENESNPEIIKLYEEGLALIKSSLHLVSGTIYEIDSKLDQIT